MRTNAKNVVAIMANDLIKYLRDGAEVPSSYHAELNRHRVLMQIDSSYYTCQMLKVRGK